MRRKKLISTSLAVVSVCPLVAGIVTFAAENDVKATETSMHNSFICLSVEGDKEQGEYLRYHLNTTGGQTVTQDDDEKNLTYQNFYSGYTTININGQEYIYGRGTDVSEPEYKVSEKSHISSQKFGDVVIEQRLSFVEGFTPGYEDMLKITYKVVSAGEGENVGVRILIDPMLDKDDAVTITADDVNIMNESIFNEKLPKVWRAENTDNSNISAYGRFDNVSMSPDSVTYANWNNVYDCVWGYKPDINKIINDAAIAIEWNPANNSANKEYVAYYGIKNNANTEGSSDANGSGSNNVNLDSPQTSVAFPAASIALGIVSIIAAAGCVIIKRKESKN